MAGTLFNVAWCGLWRALIERKIKNLRSQTKFGGCRGRVSTDTRKKNHLSAFRTINFTSLLMRHPQSITIQKATEPALRHSAQLSDRCGKTHRRPPQGSALDARNRPGLSRVFPKSPSGVQRGRSSAHRHPSSKATACCCVFFFEQEDGCCGIKNLQTFSVTW